MEELDLMAMDFSSIDDFIDNNPLELLEKAAKGSDEKLETVPEKTEKYIVELDALSPNNAPKEPVKTEVKKEELNTASINTVEVSDEFGAVGSPGKVFVPGAKRQTKAKTATKAPAKKDVPTRELQEAEITTFLDGVKNPFIEDVTVSEKPKAKQATIDDLFEDIIIETSKTKEESKAEVKEEPKVETKAEVKKEVKEEVKEEPKVETKEEPKIEAKSEAKEEAKEEVKEEVKLEEKPKKATRKRQTKKETVKEEQKEEEVDEILSEEDIKELRTTLRQIVRKELRLAIKDAFKDLSEEF